MQNTDYNVQFVNRMSSIRRLLIIGKPVNDIWIIMLLTCSCLMPQIHAYYVIARYPRAKYMFNMPTELYKTVIAAANYNSNEMMPSAFNYAGPNPIDANIKKGLKMSSKYAQNTDNHLLSLYDNKNTKREYVINKNQRLFQSVIEATQEGSTNIQDKLQVECTSVGDLMLPPENKRSAENIKPLPETEHVCEMTIRNDYQPKFGHEQNGTRVEIQQDNKREFRATFVECVNTKREQCHGIDNLMFTSECVTVFEFRPAGIRIESSPTAFAQGFVKVPIACQCRLRRKMNRILIE